jgi:hypothetical protein
VRLTHAAGFALAIHSPPLRKEKVQVANTKATKQKAGTPDLLN